MVLTDSFSRLHNYLRISLTDACNFRCVYCMPEEDMEFTPGDQLMTADEIVAMATLFVSLGVTKIRLTGGEPLVRKDAADIMKRLSALPVSLTLTTNAYRIDRFIEVMKQSGIRSINVSLDSLNVDTFFLLTRRSVFDQVYKNIFLLLEQGFRIKINVVVMKGINDAELNDFIALTQAQPIHIRFIEFMPFKDNQWQSGKVFSYREMLQRIEEKYRFYKIQDGPNDTAKHYQVEGYAGTFAVISTMTEPFCSTCNRLRLTADGKMKNCLFSKNETDLLGALRKGEDIEPLIRHNLLEKKSQLGGQLFHDLSMNDLHPSENRSMIRIGG